MHNRRFALLTAIRRVSIDRSDHNTEKDQSQMTGWHIDRKVDILTTWHWDIWTGTVKYLRGWNTRLKLWQVNLTKKLKLDSSEYDSTGHKILRTSNRTGDRRAEATQHRDAETRKTVTETRTHRIYWYTETRKHTVQRTWRTKETKIKNTEWWWK